MDGSFTIVQLVLLDETGDSCYRMRWPGEQLARQNPQWRVVNLDARAQERFQYAEQADLLIVYQSHDVELFPVLKKRRSAGLKTLVEYNDNFYFPPVASPVAEAWNSPLIRQVYERFMQEADGTIVTGPGLQQLFQGKSRGEILVLENHLPHAPQPFEKVFEEPKKEIHIGWAGSLGHVPDLLAMMPVIHEILATYPQAVFYVMGNDSLPDLVRVPKERLRFTRWGSMQQYYEFWKPVHIGIAPLIDTPYNRCRSDIKAVEMSASGVLPLLTSILPYQDFVKKTDARTFTTYDQLKSHLQSLIADPSQIKSELKKCYDYVSKDRVGINRQERSQIYRKYLPATAVKFSWRETSAYNEVEGQAEPSAVSQVVLKKVEAFLSRKQVQECCNMLSQCWNDNPLSIDLALVYASLVHQIDNALAQQVLDKSQENYPHDIRVDFVRAKIEKDPLNRENIWKVIINRLKSATEAYRHFFQGDLEKNFTMTALVNPAFLAMGHELILLYPFSASLHHFMGEFYSRLGNFPEARKYFAWLVANSKISKANQKFFTDTPLNYLQSMEESAISKAAKKF